MVIIGSRGSALVCALGAVINSAAPSFSQSVFLIGMSDQEVCERAIENSHWSSRPSARNFVEEAVARGYEVDDCVESINGSSEVARTDQNGDARTEVLEALRREEISDTAFAGIRNEVIQLYFMLERLGYTVAFSDDEGELFSRIRNALAGQREAGLARLVDLRAEEIIVALRNEAWSERSSEFLENQENFVERSDLIQL